LDEESPKETIIRGPFLNLWEDSTLLVEVEVVVVLVSVVSCEETN